MGKKHVFYIRKKLLIFLFLLLTKPSFGHDPNQNLPANKIFEAINNFSEKGEIRYVGGCVRKVINKEIVDDIDCYI